MAKLHGHGHPPPQIARAPGPAIRTPHQKKKRGNITSLHTTTRFVIYMRSRTYKSILVPWGGSSNSPAITPLRYFQCEKNMWWTLMNSLRVCGHLYINETNKSPNPSILHNRSPARASSSAISLVFLSCNSQPVNPSDPLPHAQRKR